MKERWLAVISESILGILLVQARRGKAKWLTADQLPSHVRSYLGIKPTSSTGRNHQIGDFKKIQELIQVLRRPDRLKMRSATGAYLWFRVNAPPPENDHRQVPWNIKAIRSLKDLCRYFSAEKPSQLNRRIYKATECGASISVQTPDGVWHHNGSDMSHWDNFKAIRAFTIQTIVEGSDAEVNSEPFILSVPEEEVADWISDMEAEADHLWKEANQPETKEISR